MRFFSKLCTWSNVANVLLNKIWYSFVPSVPRYLTLTPPWVHCKSQASMGPWEQRGPMASRGKSPRTARVWLRWKRFRPAIHCLEVWFMDVYGTSGGREDFSGGKVFGMGKGGWKLRKEYIFWPQISPRVREVLRFCVQNITPKDSTWKLIGKGRCCTYLM